MNVLRFKTPSVSHTMNMSRGPGKWQAMILDQVQEQGFCALVDLASGERPAARRAARLLAGRGLVELRQVGPDNRLVAFAPDGKGGAKPQQFVKVQRGKRGPVTLRFFSLNLVRWTRLPMTLGRLWSVGRASVSVGTITDQRDTPRHTTHCHSYTKEGRVKAESISHPAVCPICGEVRAFHGLPCCHRGQELARGPLPEGWSAITGAWVGEYTPKGTRVLFVIPPEGLGGGDCLVAGEFDLLADKMLKDFAGEHRGGAQPVSGWQRHRPAFQSDLLPHRAVIDEDERRHEYQLWYWSYLQAPSNWLDPNYLTDEVLGGLLALRAAIPERPPAEQYTPATDAQRTAALSAAVAFRDDKKRGKK